jgi:hypothetical protein
LEALASQGPGYLHGGALGETIVAHLAKLGGCLTLADLAAVKPVWKEPLTANYRGLTVNTLPPPSEAFPKNERFAWDCYRRFIQMYGDVVMGVQKRPGEDHEPFEVVIHALKHERHEDDVEDTKLSVDDLKELVTRFKALIKERTGSEFPQDPWKQLWGASGAVFGSWMNDRAIVYRRK